jgi:cytochrome c553
MKGRTHSLLLLAALAAGVGLTACGRNETPAPAPAPAPAPVAAASAPAAAPAGPIIAPTAAIVPTDAQRSTGATLAAQGGGGSVPACNGCHGAQGEGIAASGFPRLAGQSYAYLAHELESYADGSRKHPIMQPIAAAMNGDQRLAAAAYFSGLSPDGSSAPGAAAAGGKAPQLASLGDNARGIQGCVNCHGPGGIGSSELYPYLAGQHAAYIAAALGAWADGTRNNDPSGQMPVIAKALSADEIKSLAAYYAGQPARNLPIAGERLAAVGFTPAPAVSSGPQAPTPPAGTAGQGPEQGAATAGAQAQGPGGTGTASNGAPTAGTAPNGGAGSQPGAAAPLAAASGR